MANFTFHPPTRKHCPVCEKLAEEGSSPIINKLDGKASSSANFPIHNWYYFVLGYSPEFPDYILDREAITEKHTVADPFMGAGTTLVACKARKIPSIGIDANDYFSDVVKTKMDWSLDVAKTQKILNKILESAKIEISKYGNPPEDSQLDVFPTEKTWKEFSDKERPDMLPEKYISDANFTKIALIIKAIERNSKNKKTDSFFKLAASSIIVSCSNIRYGPGFGVSKKINTANPLEKFEKKANRMIGDLSSKNPESIKTKTRIIHGDSRKIENQIKPNSVDLMITSPPYPGDHEYTKHTRLELIIMDYAKTKQEFREIKERMIRGSTTNIYKNDNDRIHVEKIKSIKKVTDLIEERLVADNATSGFEKLYTKLVWEYFGGMYLMLEGSLKVLKEGGKISLLVSDSHAFKMVHISTAEILAEIGISAGFSKYSIEVWQDKSTTSHRYHLRENILTLHK